jgi:hypothetical protein
VVAGAMWLVMVFWHRSNLVATFFGQRSTWFTILVISLAVSLPGWPWKLVAKADVVGAVNPIESLRRDRWADIVVMCSRRAIFAGVVALFSGFQLALAYIAFAVACTAVTLGLGGQSSMFASRSYTDARIWLAITRRMPWRPMRFLADAERRGIFQEVGALYRFRHARVQQQLQAWYDVHRPRVRHWWPRYLRLIDRLQARTGDRAYTLAGARDRVDGFRKLATQNLEGFGLDLATALSILATFLRELGHRDEELEALRQLVATRHRLAEIDAETSSALAESLGQFARRLADAGRNDEALGSMTEAAEIYCQLAGVKDDAFLPLLMNSLTWLTWINGKLERPGDAARAVSTVVDSYRELLRAEPDRDRASHATSLTQLAELLKRLRREDDAAVAINEAAKIYDELARTEPDSDPAGHAESLIALAQMLEGLGHNEDAARAISDSAYTYRELARLEPGKYRPLLVESLSRLATLYRKMDRPEELSAVSEAVSVYRAAAAEAKLCGADGQGAAKSPRLAPTFAAEAIGLSLSTLSSLALRLWKLGMQREAIEAVAIGVQMAAVGAQEDSDTTLRTMWVGLGFSDRPSALMRPGFVGIIGWLTRVAGYASWENARARDWWSLADEHDTRAFRLLLAGQDQLSQAEAAKAVDCCRGLVKVCRHLANTKPADHLTDLAYSLDLLAVQLRKAESGEEEAEAAASEAQLIRHRLGLKTAQPVSDPSQERPGPQVAED